MNSLTVIDSIIVIEGTNTKKPMYFAMCRQTNVEQHTNKQCRYSNQPTNQPALDHRPRQIFLSPTNYTHFGRCVTITMYHWQIIKLQIKLRTKMSERERERERQPKTIINCAKATDYTIHHHACTCTLHTYTSIISKINYNFHSSARMHTTQSSVFSFFPPIFTILVCRIANCATEYFARDRIGEAKRGIKSRCSC